MNTDSAAKQRSQSVWGASPAGTTLAADAVPGTREFFDTARVRRAEGEMAWLWQTLPLEQTAGQRVLELGCGAGFDALALCEAGAAYTGIDITSENIERTRLHLGFYGHQPDLLQADAENLPFDDNSFDIVFSNGVLHHTPDMARAFAEAGRVLRPGGQFWVTVYHRDSIFYLWRLFLYDHILKGGWRTQSLQERLARIEFTTSDELPLVRVLSRRQMQVLLHAAGFEVSWLGVRKLAREDFPTVPGVGFVVRRLQQSTLDALGKLAGWYVVARATKSMPPRDGQ